MRRLPTALAVTGLLFLGGAPAAVADPVDDGHLRLDGRRITAPNGCYNSHIRPLIVQNRTSRVLYVFGSPNCQDEVISTVAAGNTAVERAGASVFITP
ncbi:hypothetical protein [Streptosporangium saharense]|uniref:hypothetical protein n=1 Tax=Streptosporangium saharense TaxID=1706840 RepID=UPI00332153F7